MIETFRDRLGRVMDRHAAEVAAGHVHRDATVHAVAPAPDPAELAALRAEADRLRGLLAEILGNFHEKGHPGYEGIRTGWVRVDQYARWQLAARGVPVDALRRGGLAVLDGAGEGQ